jgi:hypothetical protein
MKRYPLADAVQRLMDEREQRRLEREEREKRRPDLSLYGDKPGYVAVTKFGFACHNLAAMAIWRAHDELPDVKKGVTLPNNRIVPRVQLLLYEVAGGAVDTGEKPKVAPIGFKDGTPVWPNGQQPRLVGLLWTGDLYKQRPKLGH